MEQLENGATFGAQRQKINSNFTELQTALGNTLPADQEISENLLPEKPATELTDELWPSILAKIVAAGYVTGGTPSLAASTLTIGTITDTSIVLNWTAVANATSYAVDRATNVGFTTGVVNDIYTGTASTYTNTGLTQSTTYYYRVRAIAANYNPSTSPVVSATTAATSNAAPTATNVAFTGTTTEGQTLTGTYTYSDTESNPEGTSLKKWYRSDNTSGLNRAAISGATASTYVLQAADVGKYIQFAVTPVASAGTTTGAEVFSAYSAVIATAGSSLTAITNWPNTAALTIVSNNLTQNGTAFNGEGLSGYYFPAGGVGYVQFQVPASGVSSGTLRLGNNNTSQIWQWSYGIYKTSSNTVLAKANTTVNNEGFSDNVVLSGTIYMRIRLDGTTVNFERSTNGTTWTSLWTKPQINEALYIKAFTDLSSGQTLNSIQAQGAVAV